jgi:acyl-ACP thioesterase
VRLGDVTGSGRFRLDSAARFLQDVSNDDSRDSQMEDIHGWVVRRMSMEVERFPLYLEMVDLRTWCSGIGSHWAERRTSIVAESGGRIDAAALWVHVDLQTMWPKPLSDNFLVSVGESTQGRKVGSRHTVREKPDGSESVLSWQVRSTDIDALDHMNNAVYWEAVEEVVREMGGMKAPVRVVLEHHDAIERHHEVTIKWRSERDSALIWHIVDGERIAAATRIQLLGS